MNDPLTYRHSGHSTNLVDLLVFYMIKYKSRSIMKYLENIYYYHSVFFEFNWLGNLDEDESEFFLQYQNANKLLIRYFPVNLIHYYVTSDFNDFINILFEDNIKNDLIWNKNMLGHLIGNFEELLVNSINNDYCFKENFKVHYDILDNRIKCFVYFVDFYTEKKSESLSHEKEIDNSHVTILYRCLINKIKKKKISLENEKQLYDLEFYTYLKALKKLIKR